MSYFETNLEKCHLIIVTIYSYPESIYFFKCYSVPTLPEYLQLLFQPI